MTGLTNYCSGSFLNYLTGSAFIFGLPQISVALFTAVGDDSGLGSGFVEPVGNNYGRVQVCGTVATTLATPAGNNVLTFGGGVPAWVTANMFIYDLNTAGVIPAGAKVISLTGTTVTMSGSCTGIGVQDMDTIAFSAFNLATGTAPRYISNASDITFPTPSGSWGTCMAHGLIDNNSGQLMSWDYLGGYNWLPVTVSGSAPAVWTSKSHGYLSTDNVVYSTEYGGISPVLSSGSLGGLLTVQSPTADTFTLKSGVTAINTVTTGDGMVRKVTPLVVTAGTPVTFAGGSPGGLYLAVA